MVQPDLAQLIGLLWRCPHSISSRSAVSNMRYGVIAAECRLVRPLVANVAQLGGVGLLYA